VGSLGSEQIEASDGRKERLVLTESLGRARSRGAEDAPRVGGLAY
jgi:hypothetical protein